LPLSIPNLDDRRYQQLLDDALGRISVHNPEWTNFNKSDPGITLLELFAFLTESLLYRSNQIPERNRLKFLSLLGLPLQPATSARGLVTFLNDRGPLQVFTLPEALELRAGPLPFRTERGLDVLPVTAQCFIKRKIEQDPAVKEYYKALYSTKLDQEPPPDVQLYQTTPFPGPDAVSLVLGDQTVDQTLWLGLFLRPSIDKPDDATLRKVRAELAGKTLTLGLVPATPADGRRLPPGGPVATGTVVRLQIQLPSFPGGHRLPDRDLGEKNNAQYRTVLEVDAPSEPAVIDVPLPENQDDLALWENMQPLDAGTGDFPPSLENTEFDERVITWVRLRATAPLEGGLDWVGINACPVLQRNAVRGERLPPGTGEPDQSVSLSLKPVLPGTVRLWVTDGDAPPELWTELDDLSAAGPEVPVRDPRLPPGTRPPAPAESRVFKLDAEAGLITFGDGFHGRRPPANASLQADYDHSAGAAGNLGKNAVSSAPALPAGLKVTNPIDTWGGADAERASDGERQISRYLQHRDRLVSTDDFVTLTMRTPGVAVGRVDVLPAYHPALAPNLPGDAAGVVTVMAVPSQDPAPAVLPVPDSFLEAIACWLEPRRLVTTELFIRRPEYKTIWISVGIDVVPGAAIAPIRERVKQALLDALSPLPPPPLTPGATTPLRRRGGWPLATAVTVMELLAVALRVDGVALVRQLRLAAEDGGEVTEVPMTGLQLPKVGEVVVAVGAAPGVDEVRGQAPAIDRPFVAVPVVPQEC
jgi:hypothetical protein